MTAPAVGPALFPRVIGEYDELGYPLLNHYRQSTTACCPRETIPDSCSCPDGCSCLCRDCDCGDWDEEALY